MYAFFPTPKLPTSPTFPSHSPPRCTVVPPLRLRFIGNNTFTLQTPHSTLLIDPWLNDDLTFFSPLFFTSIKSPQSLSIASSVSISSVSAVLLTQPLADHAHPPTLSKLPRSLPVLAPTTARPLLTSLSYTSTTYLTPGASIKLPFDPSLTVRAVKGSIVGPPWSKPTLAYVIEVQQNGCVTRLYHEPHGNHDLQTLKTLGNIDAVIAPIRGTRLKTGYRLVNGIDEAVELVDAIKPNIVLGFDNGGGDQRGILTKALETWGGKTQFEHTITQLLPNSAKVIVLGEGEEFQVMPTTD